MVRCEYLGANTPVKGLGDTGKTGSWAVRKSDGTIDLCTDEVFNSSYERRKYPDRIYHMYGMSYHKGSMKYDPEKEDPALDPRLGPKGGAER